MNNRKILIGIGIVFAVAVLSHVNTLRNRYVLDDFNLVVGNEFLSDWRNIGTLFNPAYLFRPYPVKGGARPLTIASLIVDRRLYGETPSGYHLTNVVLHAFNAAGVFVLAVLLLSVRKKAEPAPRSRDQGSRRVPHFPLLLPPLFFHRVKEMAAKAGLPVLWGRVSGLLRPAAMGESCAAHQTLEPSLLAALLFALHPLTAEAVNVISFRADLLAGMFYLIALIAFIRGVGLQGGDRGGYLAVSVVSFLLALLSKELAITFPLVAVLYLLIYRGAFSRTSVALLLVLCVISGFFLLIFWSPRVDYFFDGVLFPNIAGAASPLVSFWAYTNTLLLSFLHHARTVLFPVGLSIDYLLFIPETALNKAALGAIPLVAGSVVLMRSKNRVIRFGTGFLLLAYLPVSNIIPLINTVNDRYMYVPLIGFCLAGATAVMNLSDRHILKNVPFNLFIALLMLNFYGFMTVKRNAVYADNFTLYNDAVARVSDNIRVWYNLAVSNMSRGNYRDAIGGFEKALHVNPLYRRDEIWFLMGVCHEEMGNRQKASELYTKALLVNPRDEVINRYANLFWKMRDSDGRGYIMNKAVPTKSRAASLNHEGVRCMVRGNYKNAIRYFQKATELQPNYFDAWFNLLNACNKAGERELLAKEAVEMMDIFTKNGWRIGVRMKADP